MTKNSFVAEVTFKKMVWYFTPYFTCVDVTSMNSKSFFKNNSRTNVLFSTTQHLHNIKWITFLDVHFKMPLTLYLRLLAKQVNSVEATRKLEHMSHFFGIFLKS